MPQDNVALFPRHAHCDHCGQRFVVHLGNVKKGMGRFCSMSCAKTIPVEVRFWKRVQKSDGDGCWLWTGRANLQGYGELWRDGRHFKASRISWELHFGTPPDDLLVCHRCDNPACVRPDHLFLGTQKDNIRDAVRKGRRPKTKTTSYRGAKVTTSKLTEDDVREMRRLRHTAGMTIIRIAEQFGVSDVTASKVVNGVSWRHVV